MNVPVIPIVMTSVITSVALTAAGECAEAQLVGVIKHVIKKGSRNGPVQLALVSVTRPFPTVLSCARSFNRGHL